MIERADPIWKRELVRIAFERETERLQRGGVCPEEAAERAMWFVFEVREDTQALWRAAMQKDSS